MARPLHVLVVDDSAVVRQLMSKVLAAAGMEVATAADPLIAIDKMKRARPDVLVLDLEMPRMDGLTFLRRIMAEDPLPVVICSGHARRGTRAALAALGEGALEIVTKPQLGLRDFLEESAVRLVDTVRAAAQARLPAPGRPRRPPHRPPAVGRTPTAPARGRAARPAVVAIGAFTGGPEALRVLLSALPTDAPPAVVVQHMPEGFTAAFAQHLDEGCAIEVREATDGDPLLPG